MTRSRLGAAFLGCALAMGFGVAMSDAASRATLAPPATTYVYDGVVYDRVFFPRMRSRAGRAAARAQLNSRLLTEAGAPYRVTDLTAETGLSGGATAINNAGDIAYLYDQDYNYNFGDPEVIHDDGTYTSLGEPPVDPYGDAGAIPYALNDTGDVVGVASTEFYCCTRKNFHAEWTPSQTYFGYGFVGSFAYAVNDAGVSVGQALFSGVAAAAVFSISSNGGDRHPVMLRPPKNTSWVGTATGINNAGTIIGYANNRAVVFKVGGYAQVLPVGAAGMSTSAQAINQHGDIVGNAGSQAFLYRNRQVTYLPRPPGEMAGNAVAFAVNASDEVVGGIFDPVTGTGTSFLYVNGQSYDLNALLPANSRWQLSNAFGINDSGEILAEASNASGFTSVSLKPQSSAAHRQMRIRRF